MKCKDSKRYIYRMLDGNILDEAKTKLTGHLEACSACQAELKSIEAFHSALRSCPSAVEPSKDFEQVFWQKILARQKEAWFVRFLKELESLVPAYHPKYAVGFMLLAFFIGNIGGIASMRGQGTFVAAPTASIQHFSGLQEFNGVPSYSLAASYLKTPEAEISE